MSEEARDILRDAVSKDERSQYGLGSEIAALFRPVGLKEGDIQELSGFPVKPPDFDDDLWAVSYKGASLKSCAEIGPLMNADEEQTSYRR
jgi:hypothetical protein